MGAKLGDVLLSNVKEERYNEGVETTDHPIEGLKEITDHINKKPVILTITGVVSGRDANTKLTKLRSYMNSGKLLKYTYKTAIDNVIITDMPHDHVVEIFNGFEFTFTLKQIRMAKAATIVTTKVKSKKAQPKSNKGRQQTKGNTPAKVYKGKKGDTIKSVAKKYNVSETKLKDKNRGIIGTDGNCAGHIVIVPGVKAQAISF